MGAIDAVYYEVIARHLGTDAAHAYGGFEAILQAWCETNQLRLTGVTPAQIKKSWTGNGAAKKPEMIAGAKGRGFRVKDDNEADALALLDYALKVEKLPRLVLPPADLFIAAPVFDDVLAA